MYQQVIDFWFNELSPQMWWQKSIDFDNDIKARFGQLHQQAIQGELFAWRKQP